MIENRVFKFSILVRVFVIILQVIFNNAVPDHDADAFQLPHEQENNLANTVVSFLFSGFSRWDSQYFLHIAMYGYTHENTLAFFPLFPLMVRWISPIFSVFKLSELNCMLVTGVTLNVFLSSFAAVALFKLTMVLFRSESFSLTSAILFCINPASVFFSALYSESLFSLLTFYGLYFLECGKLFRALLILGLSAATRSNGILNAGFIAYKLMKVCLNSYGMRLQNSILIKFFKLHVVIIKIHLCLAVFIVPFAAYQIYCYLLFCTSNLNENILPDIVVDYVTRNDLKIPSEPTKWCTWAIPLSYSYVQSEYWQVGFLNYFVIKQIPNFVLALPVFITAMLSCLVYFHIHQNEMRNLGMFKTSQNSSCDIFKSIIGFPYFLHVAGVTILSTCYIHIQVLTRMLFSCSPLIYWIVSANLLPSDERLRFRVFKETRSRSRGSELLDVFVTFKKVFLKAPLLGKVLVGYFIVYFNVGIFLHVNFFPWT